MKKQKSILLVLVLLVTLVLTACGTSTPQATTAPAASDTTAPASAEATATEPAPATEAPANTEKTKVTFYGDIIEYPPVADVISYMKEKLPQYEIETIPVDWSNLETVIKSGIASGAPADVYCYWPQNMNIFVSADQALDLTPYLEADGGKWKSTFVPALLDTGKIGDKYYALPLDATYPMMIVNNELFKEAGVEVKDTWTWDEFMAACEKIKAKGQFPLAMFDQAMDWYMINSIINQANKDNKLDAYLQMGITGSDPIMSNSLDAIKTFYDKKFWYPGEGALTSTRDEAKSAFMQKKAAILAEMASLYPTIAKETGFETTAVCWPTMSGDVTKTLLKGGTDGYFIPSNAKNPDAAVECLKVFLDKTAQEKMVNAGFIPVSSEVTISDPIIQKLAGYTQYLYANAMPSTDLIKFLQTEFAQDYVLGKTTKEEALKSYDTAREQAIADTK